MITVIVIIYCNFQKRAIAFGKILLYKYVVKSKQITESNNIIIRSYYQLCNWSMNGGHSTRLDHDRTQDPQYTKTAVSKTEVLKNRST